jgi:pimeloyl-ACP methyl ester carboxylesterase
VSATRDGRRRPAPPDSLETLISRFDPSAFDLPRRGARIRLEARGHGKWDALVDRHGARLEPANEDMETGALLSADEPTWNRVAGDLQDGMDAFRAGRLSVRRNLNLGVGFLAATGGSADPGRLEVRHLRTRAGAISTFRAGSGDPVIALHGLGGTKSSFLPTLAALAPTRRVVAMDFPGFGDSAKPLGAPYDARFFARSVVAVLDALRIDRAHLIGNSMGGRVAIEVGLRSPERCGRLALLSPSLAWLRERRWTPLVRLLRPELGLLQAAPGTVVDRLVRRAIPGAEAGWVAAGVDEFLRSYLTPRGRAAFYASARGIYLEEPHGEQGFWTRLRSLGSESMFVWGRQDRVVPIGFVRHVERALPAARHVELDCGHVPQLERPTETHAAIREFFDADRRTERSAARPGAAEAGAGFE